MPEPIICFEGFGFQYRAQAEPTLFDINLKIYPGEKLLIVGPSGSGKSTLGHCINGLIPFSYPGKSTGHIKVGGKATDAASLFELSKVVGTVLQDPDGQFVGLTAGEDIAFALENEAMPQSEMLTQVEAAATLVDMAALLDASPYALSGGQKQRVSMAGVLVNHVQALLFDEPLANLDPATGKQAIEWIDRLMQQTQAAVIIIEHRLEDVLFRHVDRIVLMDQGRILADLSPDELLSQDLLRASGIREPLYLSALKYAGVPIAPQMHPGRLDTLILDENARRTVADWHHAQANRTAQATHAEPLLAVSNLQFGYDKGKTVLHGVDFRIQPGEMLAIVGPNGAGKSTLAKLICGFESPWQGEIAMNGKSLAGQTIAERAAHIGYVMQNPNQMISQSMIFDEVALGLRARGLSEEDIKARVEETLRICGLYPFRTWPISALSFGQKKRVTIAAVLVLSPSIILLDEPTAGQDFRHYTDIMEFLSGLNQQGVTVLMITHDMHLMLEYAARALVMTEGRLLLDSSPAALLCNPQYTQAASLKETSLFHLAQKCGLDDPAAFAQHFIDHDREVRLFGK